MKETLVVEEKLGNTFRAKCFLCQKNHGDYGYHTFTYKEVEVELTTGGEYHKMELWICNDCHGATPMLPIREEN